MSLNFIHLKLLCGTLFLFLLFSCSPKEKHQNNKHLGLYIDNDSRKGFQYVDDAGTELTYIYVTSTITNDTTVPVSIKIDFPGKNITRGSKHMKILLFQGKLSETEHKQLLDSHRSKPWNKVLQPGEQTELTFGMLMDVNYASEWAQTALFSAHHGFRFSVHHKELKNLASGYPPSTLLAGIDFFTVSGTKAFVIPCGEISFPGN